MHVTRVCHFNNIIQLIILHVKWNRVIYWRYNFQCRLQNSAVVKSHFVIVYIFFKKYIKNAALSEFQLHCINEFQKSSIFLQKDTLMLQKPEFQLNQGRQAKHGLFAFCYYVVHYFSISSRKLPRSYSTPKLRFL